MNIHVELENIQPDVLLWKVETRVFGVPFISEDPSEFIDIHTDNHVRFDPARDLLDEESNRPLKYAIVPGNELPRAPEFVKKFGGGAVVVDLDYTSRDQHQFTSVYMNRSTGTMGVATIELRNEIMYIYNFVTSEFQDIDESAPDIRFNKRWILEGLRFFVKNSALFC